MFSTFKKIISSSLLSLFFLFLGSPLLHVFTLGNAGFIITLGSQVGNCSLDAYHCEKIEIDTFLCEIRYEISNHVSSHLREIPSNHYSPNLISQRDTFKYSKNKAPESLGENYSDPIASDLPFVSIIKIQV